MDNFDFKPYCEDAIKLASQFGKNFSYSPEDIADMDEILETIHNDYENKKISEQNAEKIAVVFGIYLGQVMLDNSLAKYGYNWAIETSEPYLAKNSANQMFPITKTWKMIVNGIEDSVKSFYDVGIAIASGKFKK